MESTSVVHKEEQCSVLEPPVAEKVQHVTKIHGRELKDDYYYLREKSNEKVLDYIHKENAYLDSKLAHTKDLQQKLFEEIVGRIQQTDLTVPTPIGNYLYYQRTVEKMEYPIYCRKKNVPDAVEEIILDHNKLAEGFSFSSLGVKQVSEDHNYMAYSHDTLGDEIYTIFVKDLRSGELSKESIPNTYYSLQWDSSSQYFWYTTLDSAHRADKVYRHKVGESHESDVLVYHEEDQKFSVSVKKSHDDKYVKIELTSQITSEVWYLPADKPLEKFILFYPRQHSVEYFLYHQNDRFLILTNQDGAKNFKLLEVEDSKFKPGSQENWVERIPYRPEVRLHDLTAFKNYLVIWQREDGIRTMRVQDVKTREYKKDIAFPESIYVVFPQNNKIFDTNTVRIQYNSLITPKSVFDYDMETGKMTLLKEEPVLGGYDRTLYESKRVYATAKDGVKVPISLLYKKGIQLNGENLFYLYGYGSYGYPIDPTFHGELLSYLDRGFAYGLAHIRGGGELGRPWYEDGKLLTKKNTFNDFIAVAEHLIAEKYTNPSKLVIHGCSAGGLLMGAVVNSAPHLFKAAVMDVPFLDVVNTMLDATLPLTVEEYEEWGNPNEKEYFDYMISYSPYDNIADRNYPNILIITALNDPRVMYWEPLKFIAKLRDTKKDDKNKNLYLFKCFTEEGHGGASGRYENLKEVAFVMSYFFERLGITK